MLNIDIIQLFLKIWIQLIWSYKYDLESFVK